MQGGLAALVAAKDMKSFDSDITKAGLKPAQ
jgi:hypothetical protein